MATAEALKNNKEWVVSGRYVSSITLVDDQGDVLFHSPLPWICGSTDEGEIDVVGCHGIGQARVVDNLQQVKHYKVGQPILLRHRNDMTGVDDRDMWNDYHCYLPIERWRLHDDGTVKLPVIAELAGYEAVEGRFELDLFTITRMPAR